MGGIFDNHQFEAAIVLIAPLSADQRRLGDVRSDCRRQAFGPELNVTDDGIEVGGRNGVGQCVRIERVFGALDRVDSNLEQGMNETGRLRPRATRGFTEAAGKFTGALTIER